MTVATSPVSDVQARIAEIQARFAMGPMPAAVPRGGQDFASVLAGAQGAGATTTATLPGGPPAPAPAPGAMLGGVGGVDTSPLEGVGRAGPSTPATPAGPASGSSLGDQAVALAKQHLGVPYVWGGESPRGFDCSGLLQYVYNKLGIDLPRVSRDQARAGVAVPSLAQARPGDLVAFGSPVDHIGIYAGDGKMVVAPRTGDVVKVQEIRRPVTAIRRVIP